MLKLKNYLNTSTKNLRKNAHSLEYNVGLCLLGNWLDYVVYGLKSNKQFVFS